MQPADAHDEYLFKVLVIGDIATGKTSLVKRYVHNFFSQHYRSTIGVDFALKVLNWDENTVIRLQLWDIAGQERFSNMTRVYYKEASGAFVVFDVSRETSFEAVKKWKADLDSKLQLSDGRSIPAVLIANKSDLEKEGIAKDPPAIDAFCNKEGFVGWFETSAKENTNIHEATTYLIERMLAVQKAGQYETPVVNANGDVRKLSSTQNGTLKRESGKSSSKCC